MAAFLKGLVMMMFVCLVTIKTADLAEAVVACPLFIIECESGYYRVAIPGGANGCTTYKCVKCPPYKCRYLMKCLYGPATDSRGCRICGCAPAPVNA